MIDLIADACISRKVVEQLRDEGYEVLYINETHNPSMPDNEIMQIGYSLGVPIATHNIRHFEMYKDLIPLPARKNVYKTVNATKRYLE